MCLLRELWLMRLVGLHVYGGTHKWESNLDLKGLRVEVIIYGDL